MELIAALLANLLQLYIFVLLAYVILSFVPRPPEPLLPLVRGVRALVEPVVEPIRRRLRPVRIGGVALDLSIILLFIVINILIAVLQGIAR